MMLHTLQYVGPPVWQLQMQGTPSCRFTPKGLITKHAYRPVLGRVFCLHNMTQSVYVPGGH